MIHAIYYERPRGTRHTVEVNNIRPEDEAYILEKDIVLSMEDAPPLGFAVYFDYGRKDEEGTPIEHIEFSGTKSCEDTIAAGVEALRRIKP